MFGKIENGRLKIAGKRIKNEKGGEITNPTEEDLIKLGYKEVEYDTKPEYDKENNKLTEEYTEEGNKIIVAYVIDELTKDEKIAVLQSEILEEEGKITARNIRNAIMGDNFAKNRITEIEGNIAELRAKIREIEEEGQE